MTQMIKPILSLFCVNLCLAFTVAAQTPEIVKVDPPTWWVGCSLNPVRLLIRGRNLQGARVEIPGLRVGALKISERGATTREGANGDGESSLGRARRLAVTD